MAKDERIAVRLDTTTKVALAEAAKDDKRTLSSMVHKIISDWLKADDRNGRKRAGSLR